MQEHWAELNEEHYSCGGLLESTGLKILVQVDQLDYQGDSLAIVQEGLRYGFCAWGWGSCSGCDALQAAQESPNRKKAFEELRLEMYQSIEWDTREGLAKTIIYKNWEGTHFDQTLVKEFKRAAAKALLFDEWVLDL